MAVWLFVFVALAVLAILGSIEQFWFDETWLSILASDQCILLITAGLLLCLLGWSLIPTSKLAKINRLLKACLLVASIVLLFVVRTLSHMLLMRYMRQTLATWSVLTLIFIL